MILDSNEFFADKQAVTNSALGANVYDLNPSGGANSIQDIGLGQDVYLVVDCNTTAGAAGAATVQVSIETADDAAFTTNDTILAESLAFALADMVAGARLWKVKLPSADYRRYLGVRFNVATGPLTAGAFSAYLVKDVQGGKQYASGFSVQ